MITRTACWTCKTSLLTNLKQKENWFIVFFSYIKPLRDFHTVSSKLLGLNATYISPKVIQVALLDWEIVKKPCFFLNKVLSYQELEELICELLLTYSGREHVCMSCKLKSCILLGLNLTYV